MEMEGDCTTHRTDDKITVVSIVMLLFLPKFWVTEIQGDFITCVCISDTGITARVETPLAFENFPVVEVEREQVLDEIDEFTACS